MRPRDFLSGCIGGTEAFGEWMKHTRLAQVGPGRLLTDLMLWPSDYLKCHQYYKANFGYAPRIWRPRTYNEKLLHAKLFRRRRRHTLFADKLAVRKLVAERVGEGCLPRIWWRGSKLLEARGIDLPERFVVKANHGWEAVLLVDNRDAFDWAAATQRTDAWMRADHSLEAGEWQYRWIEPELYIEEHLGDTRGAPPPDYKFFCFHGRVEFLSVDLDRATAVTRVMHGRDFEILPFGFGYPRHETKTPRPDCFEEMIEVAEALSAGEPFVRVDLYDVGRPVFGELTLHPGSGFDPFDPPAMDEQFGALI